MPFSTFYNSLPLFARLLAFFVLSPLFSRREIPLYVRVGLAGLCSLLLWPVIKQELEVTPLLIIREIAIGYLLGFLFSLLFEAAALAGQMVGTLGGFSATELVAPAFNESEPLISKLFGVTLFTLLIALDGHHKLIAFLYESFVMIPLSEIPREGVGELVMASSRLFRYGMELALIPLTFLSGILIIFALTSRFFPTLQIFWSGFPIQLLVAFFAIALSLTLFPITLSKWLNEAIQLIKHALFSF